MGDKQEAVVRSLLDSWPGDREAAVELLSDQATYHVSAWSEPLVGKEAIGAELDRQAGIYSNIRYQIRNIASTDAVVFTERLDSFNIGGKDITLHWASVHEFGPDAKVIAIRDYFDMKELESQLV